MPFRFGQLVAAIASLILVGAGWFFFAPTQLGGSDSYVQIYGTSMNPRFHGGDLVIVRSTDSSFRVGEIVAYHNAQLGGQVVMHRIIRITGDRYVFKGDNNSFVDSYHPTRSELVGHLWIHAPGVGKYLVWVHGPHLFLVAGIVALLCLLFGAGLGGNRFRRRRGTAAPERPLASPNGGGSHASGIGALTIGAAAVLLACAGLAALSFTRPLTTDALEQAVYTQNGRFSYDAPAPQGARIYGTTTVKTGQPLFLRIVHSVSFQFAYSLSSAKAHAVNGTIALDARVASSDGWKRTLHLAAVRPFSGDRTVVTGRLSFRSLTKLLEQIDALTNTNGGTYSLTLLPQVRIRGIIGGNAIEDHFTPQLPLTLDPTQLQLQPAGATGAGATAALTPTASGSGTVAVANRLSLLKLTLSVSLARLVSLIGGAIAAILLLVGVVFALRSTPAEEEQQIAREYGELIVGVEFLPAAPANVVQTSSMEGLARIAEQSGRMVMHAARAGVHTYFVEEAGVRYVYEHGAELSRNVAGDAEIAAIRLARRGS